MSARNNSAKGAIGSIFGAVNATGTAVTSLLTTAADSVGMLNKYVADASEKQRITSDYDIATFEEKLLDDLSTDEAKRTREIQTFFAEAPENRASWETAHQRIKAAVAARRNPAQAPAA
jgi:hypothetical protein